MSRFLATGGAGYIGTHVAAALMEAGHEVVLLDDLSNASPEAVRRLNALGLGEARLVEGDARDAALLDRLFAEGRFAGVVHLAGLKSPGESLARPGDYYAVNIGSALAVATAMRRHGVDRLVFSSSAAVYGHGATVPIREDAPLDPATPYGRSKLMIERMLGDIAAVDIDSDGALRVVSLRYFNPVGAHPSGTIGEDPRGTPANLFPFIAQTAAGRRQQVEIFADDWPTPDGTGVRDFIHVCDLAEGHAAALDWLGSPAGARAAGRNLAVNLGTGRGTSVLEAVAAFGRATGGPVPHRIAPRRPGDVAASYADPALADRLFGWRARRDLDAMCRDHWRWQAANPEGYG